MFLSKSRTSGTFSATSRRFVDSHTFLTKELINVEWVSLEVRPRATSWDIRGFRAHALLSSNRSSGGLLGLLLIVNACARTRSRVDAALFSESLPAKSASRPLLANRAFVKERVSYIVNFSGLLSIIEQLIACTRVQVLTSPLDIHGIVLKLTNYMAKYIVRCSWSPRVTC